MSSRADRKPPYADSHPVPSGRRAAAPRRPEAPETGSAAREHCRRVAGFAEPAEAADPAEPAEHRPSASRTPASRRVIAGAL